MVLMKDGYIKNILSIYELATPEEKLDGMNWYKDAFEICKGISNEYNQPIHLVAHVMSCVSPNNSWQRNIIDTKRIVSMYANNELPSEDFRGISATYSNNVRKAFQILQTGDVNYIGKGLKTISFAKNILGSDKDVTIDYHAYSVATNFRYTVKTASGLKGKRYAQLVEAYIEAGERVNITGYQMQAITWVTWRNLGKKKV